MGTAAGIPLLGDSGYPVGTVEVQAEETVRVAISIGGQYAGADTTIHLAPDEAHELAGALRRAADEVRG